MDPKEDDTRLMAHLKDVPDPRSARGRGYDWPFLWAILCSAMLAGHKSIRGITRWAHLHAHDLLAQLQPPCPRIPSASTC